MHLMCCAVHAESTLCALRLTLFTSKDTCLQYYRGLERHSKRRCAGNGTKLRLPMAYPAAA